MRRSESHARRPGEPWPNGPIEPDEDTDPRQSVRPIHPLAVVVLLVQVILELLRS
jgi:hypothetical protein